MCNSAGITPFVFGENMVRVLSDEDGGYWFVAKDVARALEYEWNGAKNIQHVPEEWRGVESVSTPSGMQEMLTLSEQGLYFFLGRSDKKGALPFQKWLAGEVLPSLRKKGSYALPCSGPGRAASHLPGEDPLLAPLLTMARSVKPHLRVQLVNLSVRLANMTEEENQRAMHIFGQLCAMHGSSDRSSTPGPAQNAAYGQVKCFADEMCLPFPGEVVTGRALYNAYVRWCSRRARQRKAEISTFGSIMARLFAKEKRGGNIMYLNLSLKQEPPKTCQQ